MDIFEMAERLSKACDDATVGSEVCIVHNIGALGISSQDILRLFLEVSDAESELCKGYYNGNILCTTWFHAVKLHSDILDVTKLLSMGNVVMNYLAQRFINTGSYTRACLEVGFVSNDKNVMDHIHALMRVNMMC